MLDVPTRRITAFADRSFASPADKAVRIAEASPAARFVVRGRAAVPQTAAVALGFPLATDVCRAALGGERVALWLGPDEWLVIAPEHEAESLGAALASALAGVPHALVDVSHRNVGLTVSGPKASYILNHGCPLDLSLAAFPVGMCTRTILAKAEVVLWRTAEDAFRLECWRSFGPYVADFLEEARTEFK
ncbi:sarcosine oxidase subunit gamma [Chthonobacter albigriseus]|uniref:sarcosine oxidase subunit gamma n=1 Tax=Chthonobacter albigriseus TaxID=1683161 RepID=UPI0015EE8E81|nr:sarcosine oxidase subunit gamma family protein [Chthonobacter albigriseus]